MKVIGAGFGRTGTLSLKAALEKLGYGPCYHMTELPGKPEHTTFWKELPDRLERGEEIETGAGDGAGVVDFEKVFAGYEATVDFPACVFWRELTQAYPDAKVLLSVRDPERWYDSAIETIFAAPGRRLRLMRRWIPPARHVPQMAYKVIERRTFGGRIWDREHAISVYNRHNKEVRRFVPKEKLLVYEVKEGWEPLCRFLGVEVPDEPFPHVNDRGRFAALMRREALAGAAGEAARKLPPVLAGAALAGALAALSARMLARAGRR